jgi:SAM-dependent methyltransferase
MISNALYDRFYRDGKYDGTLTFYSCIREHLNRASRVLNLGAGPATHSPRRILKGSVAHVVGADIDPIVLKNDELDEAVLIEDGKLALESDTFDLVFSDFVLEHVEKPHRFLAETLRVLKPGGTFLFRTPNRFHYVALVSALTPHSVHRRLANPARGLEEGAHEPWPTYYRMNSRGTLRRQARAAGFRSSEFRMIEAEPSYLMFHALPFLVGVGYERLVNSTKLLEGARCNILGKFTK